VRPINLIPPEERRGDRAPLRTGALPYVVIGALIAALAAVAAVVLTSNQISDRKTEVATLTAQQAAAEARADALTPYADLAKLSIARSATVTSLAQSRFDWDRVLRELALVLPDDVWLTQLSGTVAPDVNVENAAQVQIRSQAPGPALSIVGCATSHDGVAEFLQALRDIDGVTRVGIVADERRDSTAGSGGSSDTGGAGADCRTRGFISRFEVVAAFDAVAVPPTADSAPDEATPTATAPGDDGGVSSAQAQEQQVRDSTAQQTDKAHEAVNIIPGVVR
jgi:Tfp pilus assembly protein PilN